MGLISKENLDLALDGIRRGYSKADGEIKKSLPKKLSDLDNDLYYDNKRIEFLKLTERDCVWIEDHGCFVYVGSPKLGWLKSAEDVDFEITATIDGQTESMSSWDGSFKKQFIVVGEIQVVDCDQVVIFDSGNALKGTEGVDNFSIRVYSMSQEATFSLTIYRCETKKIPRECLDVEPMVVKVTQTDGTYSADKTFAEIKAQYESGGEVYALEDYSGEIYIYHLIYTDDTLFTFTNTSYGWICCINISNDDSCGYEAYVLEDTNNKVTSLDELSSDDQYPSAKAVYDAIQAAKPDIVTPTAESTDTQAASAKAVWDMLGTGGSGTDISLGVTGASVGDIVKVKAVDASGKPTAWETEKTYSKTQIDAIMESYVNDINALVGGDA